ncbi:MAG: XisI protein [Armatimonadota bacterium]|nr:XisI protein [Armatimonadota bacterium]
MDTLENYRQVIRKILSEMVHIRYSYADIQNEAVFDRDNDRYLVVSVGWQKVKRVHGCLVHLDIVDGKVWVQRDGTEDGIANVLVAAGIPKDRIVLGFHSSDVRPHTGFAFV